MLHMLNKHLVILCRVFLAEYTKIKQKRKKGSAQWQGEVAQTFRRDLFDDISKQEKKAVRLSYE